MPERKQHHHWRWACLAAVVILLALGLIVVGSYVAAAQEPSSPASSEEELLYDLRIGKWNYDGKAQLGGVFVYGVFYGNLDQPGTAYDVEITDILPPGTTYLGDTSGFTPDYDEEAGTVTWHVGDVGPEERHFFAVTLGMPDVMPDPPQVERNHVSIMPIEYDATPGSNESEPSDLVLFTEEDPVEIDLEVSKGPEPGEPAPGEEFQYSVNWCNNHTEVAVGPVTLIDTLPDGVHYVDWYPAQEWQNFWNLIGADDDQVVLEAPGLPGNWCQQIYIVLRVDASVPVSTTLENTVEIHVDGDVNPENDVYVNTDAHVSSPRADLAVRKQLNGGMLKPDGVIAYTVDFWNQGNMAVDALLVDTLPPFTTYQEDSAMLNGMQIETDVVGNVLTWDVGTVPVNQGGNLTFAVDIDEFAPLELLENRIEIIHAEDEETPWDNESSVAVQLYVPGPNLHVEKWSQWNGDSIHYTFFAANLGDVAVNNIIIIDSYPEGTIPMGDPSVPQHLQEKTGFHFEDPHMLVVEITSLEPGEGGWFDFSVGGIDPEIKPAEFYNYISIVGDMLPEDDVNPADNEDEDLIVIPAIDRVELWLEPDGQSSMSGQAIAGQPLTVTTPLGGEFYTMVGMDECLTCWQIEDTGMVNEGDEIGVTVKIGEGEQWPMTFGVPLPFTAVLDREADTVSGQIDHLDTQPMEVRGWWEGGWQQLMTNEGGEYEAVYGDPIPPGAQGATYFDTMVDYTQVAYYRHFLDMSLILQVNYDHDWIQGSYEPGHTVWLTVTKGIDEYTITLDTVEVPWSEGGGFLSEWGAWDPERPNIEPGDLVEGEVDNGQLASLTVGEITGWVDADTDSIEGEVHAEWLPTDVVDVECQPWGGPEGAPSKWDSASVDGTDPYFCGWDPDTEWDIIPGQDLAVSYYEPAGHQVIGVFAAPWMRVNYAHDWVGGNYPLGHTFVVTVTQSDEVTEKGIAVVEVTSTDGWGGSGFSTQEDNWIGSPPDIVPGDFVYFHSDDGYEHTIEVGDIGGTLNLEAESIGGPIVAPFGSQTLQVRCEIQREDAPEGKDSEAGADGDPEYYCDWAGEYDLQPGHDVAVMYTEPDDGDRVINVFRVAAPDMSVGKGSMGGDQFAPGGFAVFQINYSNDGDGVADPASLVDTLPPGVAYVEDTSGFSTSVVGDTVEWDLGTVAPGEGGQFQLLVQILDPAPDPPPETLTNMVDIAAEFDTNPDNDHSEATIRLADEASVELYVNKSPMPGDPAPGSTYIYEIEYGNSGSVATGEATLTDILPYVEGVCSTTVVEWYSQNGYDLWTDVSADDTELVLTAPTLPAQWGDRIILRLRVDADCELGTQLENTVRLEAPPAEMAEHTNGDAQINEPYVNAHLEKGFGWGVLVPGGEIGYNLQVANHGNLTATVTLTDVLPVGASYLESGAWNGQEYVPLPVTLDVGTVSWELGEIPPGSWLNIDLHLAIDPGLAANDVLTNCAEITVLEEDAWPFDNSACRTDAVREEGPNLRIHKDYRWNWEGQLHYEIAFQNVGTELLSGVEIVDTLPEGTTFHGEWSPDFWQGFDIIEGPGTLSWILPDLEPGWSGGLWFNVDLDLIEQGDSYTNTAEADVPGDVWTDDNVSEVTAYTGPDVYIKKWLSDGEVRPGEIVTFTVEFGNRNKWPWSTDQEDPPAPPTTITDDLPDELIFIKATDPHDPESVWEPGEYDEATNTVIWGFHPMPPESSWTFQIVVQVAEDAEMNTVIVNTVEARSNSLDDVDPLPDNNTFDLELTIAPNYAIYLPLISRNY